MTVRGSMIRMFSSGLLALPRKSSHQPYMCVCVPLMCASRCVKLSLLFLCRYREFPVIRPNAQLITSNRPYLCNFLGTVYKNSSREALMHVLKQSGLEKECLTAARDQ